MNSAHALAQGLTKKILIGLAAGAVVIAFVQAQVFNRASTIYKRPLQNDRFERIVQQFMIVHIGPSHYQR